MRIFRRKARGSEHVRPDQAVRRSDQRPSWMSDGASCAVRRQRGPGGGRRVLLPAQRWHLAGAHPGKERVREDICAVLVAEDGRSLDPDAVAVWINGLKVGRLSRENAQRTGPACSPNKTSRVCRLPLRGSSPVAVSAATGWGNSGCSCGMIRRTLACHVIPSPAAKSRMRTGLSDASRLTLPMIPTTWLG